MARSRSASWAAGAAAFLAGLAFGVGAFFDGYYAIGQWAPLALAALALLLALAIASPALPRGPAAVACGSLLALALWALVSTRWAESADQALVDGSRLLLYAALLGALLLLLRGRGLAAPLLAGIVAPLLGLAGYVLAKLLAGEGPGLFVANRLNEPLNYVNGMAAYLLVAFWPLLALAERARSAPLAGASLGCAVAMLGVALLTQSRGGLLALLVSAALLLALAPGRLRRGWALFAVAGGVALALGLGLRDALAALPEDATAPSEDDLRSAALATLAAAALAGAAWGTARRIAAGLAVSDEGAGERGPARARRRRSASTVVLCALALLGAVAVAVPPGERIDEVRDQYDAFTELRPASADGRLASGGGNRYDYWRVALDQFSDDPLRGTGAGNYDRTYYLERRSAEDIRQPHSIELQALAETGLIGGLSLAGFLGAVLAALWLRLRRRGEGEDGDREAGIALAAGGIFLVWLVQTSVDWLHLIPGLTATAIAAAAVLLEPWMGTRAEPAADAASETGARSGPPAIAVPLVTALVVALAAVTIAIPALAERERDQGWDRLASDPRAALESARDSLALNDESVPSYVLEAAALARLGDYRGARASLLEATRREPHDFVPWGLLGDLEVRRGDEALAARYYRRASALNPRDAGLAELAGR